MYTSGTSLSIFPSLPTRKCHGKCFWQQHSCILELATVMRNSSLLCMFVDVASILALIKASTTNTLAMCKLLYLLTINSSLALLHVAKACAVLLVHLIVQISISFCEAAKLYVFWGLTVPIYYCPVIPIDSEQKNYNLESIFWVTWVVEIIHYK